MQASNNGFLFRGRLEPRQMPGTTNPMSGNQTAYNHPEPSLGKAKAVAPVVLTVNVAGVPGAVELGAIEHPGANVGEGCTEHERTTEPLNPPVAAMFTVEVDDPPGLNVLGVRPVDESEKSGDAMRLNVAVADAVVVRVQGPGPEQPPLHPEKLEPAPAVGVSVAVVPLIKFPEQVLLQLMPAGLLVTVPLPLPANTTETLKVAAVPVILNTTPLLLGPPNCVVP
jgi:hypothetical protein